MAEAAINVFCGEEFQEIYALDGGFPTSIPSVAARGAGQDALWAGINTHKAADFNAWGTYPYDAYFADWDNIVEYWDREVLRSS